VKKAALVLLVLLVVVGIAPAQEEGGFVAPWSAPVPDVQEGALLIPIGFWADVVGIGLIAGATPAFSLSFGAGMTLFQLGVSSLVFVGNTCLQIGMTRHHDALIEKGFDVSDENLKKSRLLHYISLGCGGGAVLLGIGAAVTDSTGLAIASIVAGGAGAGVEIFNFYVNRRNWGLDMKEAAGVAQ